LPQINNSTLLKMKQVIIGLLLLSNCLFSVKATEKEKSTINFKFYGYIRYEGYWDSRQSIASRIENVYLFPRPEKLDIIGNDINDDSQFTMLSYQTRAGVKISGPSILGAKTTAVLEGDFMGTASNMTGHIRLRQAFVKLDWNKTNLILGQYWHPIFVPQIFPNVVATGAAVPFYPLNRSPQVRFTYKPFTNLSVSATVLGHAEYRSVGPTSNPQQNSGVPEFAGQVFYNSKHITLAATIAYRTIQPNKLSVNAPNNDKKLSSVNYSLAGKFSYNGFVARAGLLYGGNMSSLKMIGGYAVSSDKNEYTNINTLSQWFEIEKTFDKITVGIFAGRAKNTGANDNIKGDIYYFLSTDGKYIDETYRISPKVGYSIKNFNIFFEPMYSTASWGDMKKDNKKVTNSKTVSNTRMLFSVMYKF